MASRRYAAAADDFDHAAAVLNKNGGVQAWSSCYQLEYNFAITDTVGLRKEQIVGVIIVILENFQLIQS